MPVLDHLVSISAGIVPEPALCPGAGFAERSQETLHGQKGNFSKNRNKNPKNELSSDFIFVYNRVICDL